LKNKTPGNLKANHLVKKAKRTTNWNKEDSIKYSNDYLSILDRPKSTKPVMGGFYFKLPDGVRIKNHNNLKIDKII